MRVTKRQMVPSEILGDNYLVVSKRNSFILEK